MERKYYRIKTLEEFGGIRSNSWNHSGEMDYLYGKFISNLEGVPETFQCWDKEINWKLKDDDVIEMTPYTEMPLDVKEGDSFVFVSNSQMNNDHDPDADQHLGKIVTLKENDGSDCPSFNHESFANGYEYWDWGHLAPCSGVEEANDIKYKVLVKKTEEKTPLKTGDIVRVRNIRALSSDATEADLELNFIILDFQNGEHLVYNKDFKHGHSGSGDKRIKDGDECHWWIKSCNLTLVEELSEEYIVESSTDSGCFPNAPRPDEKVGTKYKVLKESDFGKIVSLKQNDDSSNPYFWYENEENYSVFSWCRLGPYSETKVEVGTKENPFKNQRYPDEVIGTEYEVICTTEYYKIGDRVIFEYDDNTHSPRFINTRTGRNIYINWKNLTKIKTNLNLNTQHGSKISTTSFNPESFVRRVSATYSPGSSPVGIAICYSGEEILVGSEY